MQINSESFISLVIICSLFLTGGHSFYAAKFKDDNTQKNFDYCSDAQEVASSLCVMNIAKLADTFGAIISSNQSIILELSDPDSEGVKQICNAVTEFSSCLNNVTAEENETETTSLQKLMTSSSAMVDCEEDMKQLLSEVFAAMVHPDSSKFICSVFLMMRSKFYCLVDLISHECVDNGLTAGTHAEISAYQYKLLDASAPFECSLESELHLPSEEINAGTDAPDPCEDPMEILKFANCTPVIEPYEPHPLTVIKNTSNIAAYCSDSLDFLLCLYESDANCIPDFVKSRGAAAKFACEESLDIFRDHVDCLRNISESVPELAKCLQINMDEDICHRSIDVQELVQEESGAFVDLLRKEQTLDLQIAQVRLHLNGARKQPMKVRRRLRIYVDHTIFPALKVMKEEDEDIGPPSWKLEVQGKLLEEGPCGGEAVGSPAKFNNNLLNENRKFTSFFKSVIIELDKDIYGPDNHVVQWHRTPKTKEMSGFSVKRPGDVNVKCTILLYLDHQPMKYKLQSNLAKLLEVRTVTWANIIDAFWQYIKTHKLQDVNEPGYIHCDHRLEQILGCRRMRVSEIRERLNRFLSPPDPIHIDYLIIPCNNNNNRSQCVVDDADGQPAAWTMYDIDVEIDDPIKDQMLHHQASVTNRQTTDVRQLDNKVADLSKQLKEAKMRRDGYLKFAEGPKEFIQKTLSIESEDLVQTLTEEERKSELYNRHEFTEEFLKRTEKDRFLECAGGEVQFHCGSEAIDWLYNYTLVYARGSDEFCDIPHPDPINGKACSPGFFHCFEADPEHDDLECIPDGWVCDGHAECYHEEDERDCQIGGNGESSDEPFLMNDDDDENNSEEGDDNVSIESLFIDEDEEDDEQSTKTTMIPPLANDDKSSAKNKV